jgi:hypothetical protein
VRDGVGITTLRKTLDPQLERAIGFALDGVPRRMGLLDFIGLRGARAPTHDPSISELLERHDPRYVAALSDEMRRVADLHFGDGDRLSVGAVLGVVPEAAFALMNHWSGYVREASVRAIRDIRGGFALALLVHRLNDWVPQVAKAAERKLREVRPRLEDSVVASDIEHLWAFTRYGRVGAGGRQLINELVNSEGVLVAVCDLVSRSNDARAVRLSRRLLEWPLVDSLLPALARDHPNGGVRAVATQALLSGVHRWMSNGLHERVILFEGSKRELAMAALADRSPKVQLAAVGWVVDNRKALDDAADLLMRFVTHPAPSVAWLAQFGLSELSVDWLSFVRARLVGPDGPRVHVANTLAARGNEEDGRRICGVAAEAVPRVRLALLGASARLQNAPATSALTEIALSDGSVERARLASGLLKSSGNSISADQLLAVADKGAEFLGRGLGRFVARLDALSQVEIMGRLERAGAKFDLDGWFEQTKRKTTRAAFLPSEAQWTRLRALLVHCPETRARARRLFGRAID